ncbi:unnamed protein product [Rangifer tarandus platyrhynchus]|uniref:Uncharacterized protein n=1 Tax=Rangifer tarandus platyrhynchus TaxID=3082113 RepID=A0ABN8XXX6_RANTA|nr:unnamed protein product [Rangifer tarandus platyrhynchus]
MCVCVGAFVLGGRSSVGEIPLILLLLQLVIPESLPAPLTPGPALPHSPPPPAAAGRPRDPERAGAGKRGAAAAPPPPAPPPGGGARGVGLFPFGPAPSCTQFPTLLVILSLVSLFC